MSIVLRVAERHRLVPRVAARARWADTIGDPKDLYEQYKAAVAKFGDREALAKKYVAAFEELVKQKALGATPEQERAIRENGMVETLGVSDDGKRRSERDLSYEVTMHMAQHGFGKIKGIAQKLCWAIMQQLVLPPKIRKSVEAATKFYDREPRMPKGKTYEETLAKRVMLYLGFLEDFRKHEKLFGLALQQGKSHVMDDASTTRLKAGPFVVVNTGGFDTDTMVAATKLVEEAAKLMAGIGQGRVCYGDVLLSNRLAGRANNAAFYVVSSDEMFVRADIKTTEDTVRVVCHELSHRLENKFLKGKKNEITQLYAKINTHAKFMSDTEMPDFGSPLTYKGALWKVIERDARRRSVKIAPANPLRCFVCAEKGRTEHVPDEEHKFPIARKETISMPAATFYKLQGKEQKVDPLDFITAYAKTDPSENFAEMVAFYAIGKLPKEQIDLLLPLL